MRRNVFILVCLVTSFVLFGNTLKGGFTLDDLPVVKRRIELRSLKNLPQIALSSWHPQGEWIGNYRPLVLVSFAVNFVFSEKPWGFHLVNIIFHGLNAALMFLLVSKFANRRIAYLSAILFLVIPIHSEAVASIVGRVYVLGTFFALLCLIGFFEKKYLKSSVFLLLAVLSGDFFISLWVIIGALLLFENRGLINSFRKGVIFLAPAPIYFGLRYLALGKYAFGGHGFIDPIIGPLAFLGVKERIFTGFTHLFIYLKKTFYPIGLSPDYSFNQIPAVSNIFNSAGSLIGLAFFIFVIFSVVKGRGAVKIAALLFAVPYVFISNIFFVTTGTIAERWWYFPSIGLMILTAVALEWLIVNFGRAKLFIYAIGAIVLIWYVSIIIRQNNAWLNNRSLFTLAAANSPNSAWARTNLAEEYFSAGNFDKAREEIAASLAITDKNSLTLYVLGKLYWRELKFEEASEVFLRAVEFDLNNRNKRIIFRTLAMLNLDRGDNKKALGFMEEAVKWPPEGGKQNVIEVDNFLLEVARKYSGKSLKSYSKDEIMELGKLIKTLRGF